MGLKGEDVLSMVNAFNAREPKSSKASIHVDQPCFTM